MTKIFIRDKNNKIIGEQELMEQGQYVLSKIELENQLLNVNNKINLVLLSLDGKLSKKDRIYFLNKFDELKLEMKRINKLIEQLNYCIIYNHFIKNDFNVEKKDSLEFTPILSEKQKKKNKQLTIAYSYCRNKKRDNFFITLDSNDYK